jgi:hypothetical protein
MEPESSGTIVTRSTLPGRLRVKEYLSAVCICLAMCGCRRATEDEAERVPRCSARLIRSVEVAFPRSLTRPTLLAGALLEGMVACSGGVRPGARSKRPQSFTMRLPLSGDFRLVHTLELTMMASYYGETFYDLLDVEPWATPEEIGKSYRRQVKDLHTDAGKVSNDAWFKLLVEAYETLSDPTKRQQYDAYLRRRADKGDASSAYEDQEPEFVAPQHTSSQHSYQAPPPQPSAPPTIPAHSASWSTSRTPNQASYSAPTAASATQSTHQPYPDSSSARSIGPQAQRRRWRWYYLFLIVPGFYPALVIIVGDWLPYRIEEPRSAVPAMYVLLLATIIFVLAMMARDRKR